MEEQTATVDVAKLPLVRRLRIAMMLVLGAGVTVGAVALIVLILRLHYAAVAEEPVALQNVAQPPPEKAAVSPASPRSDVRPVEPGSGFGIPYEIRAMTVPIGNRRQTKAVYLQFTILFDCPSEPARAFLGQNRAKLRNSLYEVAMRFSETDFRTKAGFERFKAAIESELKEVFQDQAPKAVAFRDWLIN